MPEPIPRLLDVREAAQYLGVSRATLFRLMNERRVSSVKIGRRRLVPVAAVDDFISSLTRNAA